MRERDERAESFIPYKQFKPLLRDGMTFIELRDAVCARIGLVVGDLPGRYHLATRPHRPDEPLKSVMRSGLWIITSAQAEADAHGRDAALHVLEL